MKEMKIEFNILASKYSRVNWIVERKMIYFLVREVYLVLTILVGDKTVYAEGLRSCFLKCQMLGVIRETGPWKPHDGGVWGGCQGYLPVRGSQLYVE